MIVNLVPCAASTPDFRDMLDAYADEIAQYQTDDWAQYVRELARDGEGHLPWPSLGVGPAQEGVAREVELLPLELREDGRVLGFMVVRLWDSPFRFAEIRDFYVKPEHRRQGYGRLAVEQYQSMHPEGILIEVWRRNAPAIFFWTALGFERIGDSTRWGEEVRPHLAVHGWPRGRFNIGKP